MKKLVLLTVSAIVMSMAVTGCSGGNAQKERDDSIRRADSLAAVEASIQEDLKAAEQARLDSIRQDSIAKAENDKFLNALPDPKKIVWDAKAGKYLKSLGFEGSSKGNEDYAEGTYTLTMGDKTCKVHYTSEFNVGDTEVTITGDDDALDKFYKKASKMKASYEEGGTTVEKKGNTIYISSFGA